MTRQSLLYRIVHQAQAQGAMISLEVFRPYPTGTAMLSVYDGDEISLEDVLRSVTARLSVEPGSFGVVGVTVEECRSLGLRVKRDETAASGHAAIDFVGLSPNQVRQRARGLRDFAMARGWIVQP